MISDAISVTRLADHLDDRDGHRSAIERALFDDYSGYPLHADIETVGDLRRIGAGALAARFPEIGRPAFDWLFAQLGDAPAPASELLPPADTANQPDTANDNDLRRRPRRRTATRGRVGGSRSKHKPARRTPHPARARRAARTRPAPEPQPQTKEDSTS